MSYGFTKYEGKEEIITSWLQMLTDSFFNICRHDLTSDLAAAWKLVRSMLLHPNSYAGGNRAANSVGRTHSLLVTLAGLAVEM